MLHSPVNSCVFGCAITLVYCPWRSRPPYSVTPLHTHTHTHATLTCLPLCIRLHRNTGVLPMEIQTPMFSNPPPHTHTHMHATLTCLPLCIWLHRNTGVLPMEIQTPVFSNPPPYTHTRMLHSPVYPCVFSCAVTLVYCPWWSRPPCSVTPLHTHTHTHTHARYTHLFTTVYSVAP